MHVLAHKGTKVRVNFEEDGSSGGCEGEHDDPLLVAKKRKLHDLERQMKEREREFQNENNWLQQAQNLIHTLQSKTRNVHLHLQDLHKQMTDIHFDEKQVKKDMKQLEEKSALTENLVALEKELQELVASSENVKYQVKDLNDKRVEYRTRIESVKKMLTDLKNKHNKNKQPAPQQPIVVTREVHACPCHLPIIFRPLGCNCPI